MPSNAIEETFDRENTCDVLARAMQSTPNSSCSARDDNTNRWSTVVTWRATAGAVMCDATANGLALALACAGVTVADAAAAFVVAPLGGCDVHSDQQHDA